MSVKVEAMVLVLMALDGLMEKFVAVDKTFAMFHSNDPHWPSSNQRKKNFIIGNVWCVRVFDWGIRIVRHASKAEGGGSVIDVSPYRFFYTNSDRGRGRGV